MLLNGNPRLNLSGPGVVFQTIFFSAVYNKRWKTRKRNLFWDRAETGFGFCEAYFRLSVDSGCGPAACAGNRQIKGLVYLMECGIALDFSLTSHCWGDGMDQRSDRTIHLILISLLLALTAEIEKMNNYSIGTKLNMCCLLENLIHSTKAVLHRPVLALYVFNTFYQHH